VGKTTVFDQLKPKYIVGFRDKMGSFCKIMQTPPDTHGPVIKNALDPQTIFTFGRNWVRSRKMGVREQNGFVWSFL
jgi:hypothetical protein